MKIFEMQRVLSGSVLALALAIDATAHAQAQDQAAARSLFDEGRRLASAGQYAAACPKFEAAANLYPSAGVLLNLGDCYEKTGRTASAWTEFGEAASLAMRTERTQDATEANRRQAALDHALVRMNVRVESDLPNLTIRRDGTPLPRAAWGTAIPVDAGPHELRAEAEGYEPWVRSVDASARGQTMEVVVPALHPLPGPRSAGPVTESPRSAAVGRGDDTRGSEDNSPQGTGPQRPSQAPAWALLIGGAAVGIGGAALMIVESGRASEARNSHDVAEYNSARAPWAVGLGAALLGGASVAGGTLWLLGSKGDAATGRRTIDFRVAMIVHGGNVDVRGSW